MADDKRKKGKADRRQVAAGEGYEVNYFAQKHGLSAEQARDIIARVGNDRDELNKAGARTKGKRGQR